MDTYSTLIFPGVLVVLAALTVAGIVTLVWVGAHRALKWAVTATYIAVLIQAIAVVVLLFSGYTDGLATTIGYLLVALILLPLLGIGRLGEPEAAAIDPDPHRPVLAPDQVARVDAGAAIIVAITMAVVIWRLEILLAAAA